MTALRLTLDGLAGGWGDAPVFDDLSLTVDFAERGHRPLLPIMGRTGVGKSTLLAILAALKPPLAGRMRWTIGNETLDIGPGPRFAPDVARFRARHFAMLFQNRGLLPFLTLGENIALCARKPVDAAALLAEVAVAGKADQRALSPDTYPHRLSGGQRQRVALAMALATDPTILFADEPGESLDEETHEQIMALLHIWACRGDRRRALVWITHDATDPARLDAPHILTVESGGRGRLQVTDHPALALVPDQAAPR